MALGGVVAAGLGAAAAIWVMPQLDTAEPPPSINVDAIKADAVTAATQAGSEAGAEAARQAIAALPAAEDAAGEGNAAEGEAALRTELQAQAEKIAALEAALAGAPAQSASTAPASGGSGAQIAALQAELKAQAEKIAALSARPVLDEQALAQVQALAQNADQVRAEIDAAAASAQESLAAVQNEATAATQRAQAVASVAVLGAALEHGGSPSQAVQQLEDAGVQVPEALAQEDLPTLVQIQMGYDGVARTALRESLKAESRDGGAMTAVGNFLRVQTGARSVEPREGEDADAVLSRAGALVEQGEISAALDELAALPPEGQAAMEGWMAQARAYLDAEAALNDVATTLN